MSRRNPFDEIERMFERMNRQLGELSEGSGMPAPTGGGGSGPQTVSMDVAEQDEEYVVTADLPGYEKKNIDLSISERTLRVSAEREDSTDESNDDGTYLRRERRRQSVSRAITLPEEVEEEESNAVYNNGVLTITLPKRDRSSDSRSIDIS
ncbi:heat-shock protein Hsp20 [Halobacteriales archaeon QS_8_65_32]|jgi:HSP20 family protein|nr:MAG: heat-shock protein Hsp20 [Halobacteriales archaeon QS_8_65_32]